MPPTDSYRLISTFELKPVYISLGLPKSSFGKGGVDSPTKAPFDAVLNAGKYAPDCIWLFKGENYYTFNLATKEFVGEPLPILGFFGGGGNNLPLLFATGIDSVVWAGPAYPHLWYIFKDNLFIRLNAELNPNIAFAPVDIQPTKIFDGWWSAQGTWFADGCDAALHCIEPRYNAMLHLFKGSEYIRHNLNDGHAVAGPIPISEQWNFPEPFIQGIDLAFYGIGDEAEKIYFFRGGQCLLYNTDTNQSENIFAVEDKFPALAQYFTRPQIFIVENYVLNTYVGSPVSGKLIDTVPILAHQKKIVQLVTETTQTTATTVTQSILESQDSSVADNFYDEMKNADESGGDTETYRYNFDASFHGDASVTGFGGGEVNANLHAKGGTDNVRFNFRDAAFKTISSQINKTSKQLNQKVFQGSEEYKRTEFTRRFEEVVIDNSGTDKDFIYEYYQQLQPYLTLLILRRVRLAFSDGTGQPQVTDISSVENLLAQHISETSNREDIKLLISSELSSVNDYEGTPRSLIKETNLSGSLIYQLNPNLESSHVIKNPDGSEQTIMVDGVIKGVKEFIVPTEAIKPVKTES
jgi:hypothetical protein